MALTSFASVSQVQCKKTNVFYLSVGSAHYYPHVFENVPSTINSAKVFEKFMKSVGGFGRILLSSSYCPLSKEMILAEMQLIIDSINRTDSGTMNILFVYLCGHGFADKNTSLQFFAPGSIKFDIADKESVYFIRQQGLSYYDFNGYRTNPKITKLILLFDCCYELAATTNSNFYWTDKAIEERKTWSDSMKNTREYYLVDPKNTRERQIYADQNNSLCTIINAGQPGVSVRTVNHPFTTKEMKIGPLCRRILLASQRFSGNTILIDDFVMEVLKSDLDKKTGVPKALVRDFRIQGACFTKKKKQ